ncbi:MAG: hypothetical protein NTZ90_17180 [Proteobacteria bacterium]|nr:hypothetical protein [Pseudomonadota bacterium]
MWKLICVPASWVWLFLAASQSVAAQVQDQDLGGGHVDSATYFGGLGSPNGACGMPQWLLETPNYLALNMNDAKSNGPGEYDRGHNCGRWVEVTLSKFCKSHDHAEIWNMDGCKNGTWEDGPLTDAKVNFIVADGCPDGNYWCQWERNHVDLASMALGQFGGDLNASKWRNPQVTWRYIDAPGYSGDVRIGFLQQASAGWPAILVTHLERGLHRVEQMIHGNWVEQQMFMTLGQIYLLRNVGNEPFRIRLFDAEDRPNQGGRVYTFTMPGGCCGKPFNEVNYVVE